MSAAVPMTADGFLPVDTAAWQDIHLSLAELLVQGGDERLRLDPETSSNVYGCAPGPRAGIIEFCSCTASCISGPAFERIGRSRDALVREMGARGTEAAFEHAIETQRRALLTLLGLNGMGVEVVFSPSGTDSQLHALLLARLTMGGPITSIVCASDQTGSGTAFTSRGQHYSASTAQGKAVERGAAIDDATVGSVGIPLFGSDGSRLGAEEIDKAVTAAVAREIAAGRKVLLQTMESSKLGWRAPTDACAKAVQERWPHHVQVVVDACQMRSGRARLREALERGWIVLLTGSKFFTAPAFCGALLVPGSLSCSLGERAVPKGLAAYATRFDLPRQWESLRRGVPAVANFGQWLRWEAALEEMRAFYALSTVFSASLFKRLAAAVPQVMAASRTLEWLGDAGGCPLENPGEEMPVPTVFPFFVNTGRGRLGHEAMVRLYRALIEKLSRGETEDERRAAAAVCQIGQPVKLVCGSVLRLAIGSRTACEAWHPDDTVVERNIQRIVANCGTVARKIDLIAEDA